MSKIIGVTVGTPLNPDQYSGGGGTNTLIVTYEYVQSDDGGNDAASKSTHSASEIYQHVQNGGVAVFEYWGEYVYLSSCTEETAIFSTVRMDGDDRSAYIITVDNDKSFSFSEGTLGGGGGGNITVDSELDRESTNAIENKVVAEKFYIMDRTMDSIATSAKEANEFATSMNIVTPFAYGAVGDGEEDDTEAIQKALNAAQRTGKPLYIPAGTYLVSKTISTYTRDTDASKQSKALNIFGAGMNTKFVTAEDFEGDYVFHIDVANAQPRQLWVHDFAIDLVADVSGIYFREIGMKSVVDNLWITHLYDKDPTDTNVRAGIYCHQSTVTTFSRIKVYGNRERIGQGHENIGIVCEKTYSTKFIDCDIIFCRWAIYLSGGSNNVVERCRIDENEYGVYQNSSANAYMDDTRAYPRDDEKFVGTFRNLTIRGNRFERNNKQAIFLCSYGAGGLNYLYNAQITIADNDFSGLGLGRAFQTSARDVFRKAIHLHNCKGVVIENNAFAGMPYEDDLIDVVGNRIVHASTEAIADAKLQKYSQNIAGSNVEDITFRSNVAITKPAVGDNDEHLKDENGEEINYKTNPKIGAEFIANNNLASFADDIEVDQSTRSTNIDIALDRIIAIQESLIGGDGE